MTQFFPSLTRIVGTCMPYAVACAVFSSPVHVLPRVGERSTKFRLLSNSGLRVVGSPSLLSSAERSAGNLSRPRFLSCRTMLGTAIARVPRDSCRSIFHRSCDEGSSSRREASSGRFRSIDRVSAARGVHGCREKEISGEIRREERSVGCLFLAGHFDRPVILFLRALQDSGVIVLHVTRRVSGLQQRCSRYLPARNLPLGQGGLARGGKKPGPRFEISSSRLSVTTASGGPLDDAAFRHVSQTCRRSSAEIQRGSFDAPGVRVSVIGASFSTFWPSSNKSSLRTSRDNGLVFEGGAPAPNGSTRVYIFPR